ncbi:30S ribosomal protein S4 [uncultured archaeon]|nr:30S ribosomal protein S4 [uncultured archaeon]
MGDPKKIRKKYATPSLMWDTIRLQREHSLRENYGLKNLRELWILASELRRVRKNVRDVLAGRTDEQVGKDMIARLSRYNVVKGDAKLDDILVVNVESFLERRLQTVVFRKGMAKSMKQARQLVSHGIISINGRRVTSPGHLVLASEEDSIAYFKPINLEQPIPVAPAPAAAEGAAVEGAVPAETGAVEVEGAKLESSEHSEQEAEAKAEEAQEKAEGQ